jgi:4-hydroxy-tetrahydrodipicolinate synthase
MEMEDSGLRNDDLRKLIQGPIATVPTPFDDRFEIDYGRMAEATHYWVENGLVAGRAVIKVAAAMGEGPMLRDDEWPALLRTVVQSAHGKGAIVCGIHYKDTKRTIEDAKRAQDLGAIALQISPPIFNDPSQDDILRYYADVSDAIDIGIMVYNTHWLRGGTVTPETIRRMVEIEHIVSIKWSNPEGVPYEEMRTFSAAFNVIDNSSQPVRCHQLGGRGFINLTSEIYPAHDLAVWDLLENRRHDEAQVLFDHVNVPLREFYARVTQKSGGQARLKKGMMALIGRPMGASRPPSQPLDDVEMSELREIMRGFGWPIVIGGSA